VRRQVVLLAEHRAQAASRRVTRDTCAIDTAPDDQDVAGLAHRSQR